jgi:hypothetical protein
MCTTNSAPESVLSLPASLLGKCKESLEGSQGPESPMQRPSDPVMRRRIFVWSSYCGGALLGTEGVPPPIPPTFTAVAAKPPSLIAPSTRTVSPT